MSRPALAPGVLPLPNVRWIPRLLTVLVLFAMAIPTAAATPTSGGAAHAPISLGPGAPAPSSHPGANAAPSAILPGSTGPPGPAVSEAELNSFHLSPSHAPIPLTLQGSLSSSDTTTPAGAGVQAPTSSLGGLLAKMKERMAQPLNVKPSVYQVPIGWFSGYINDSSDRNGIGGMLVQVYSSALCSTNRCPSTLSQISGYFNVTCPAAGGPGSNDAIVLTTNNWWFDNVSYHACVANQTTYVGTIYLVRDGVGIGFVKDASSGNPVVGVQVQAYTRDLTVLAYPAATTGINGSFMIALPPVPAKVLVSPPPGYQTTFNFTDATPGTGNRPSVPPWYGGVNMGTFYLTHQTLVVAHLYDSETQTNLTGGAQSALTACDAFGGGCNNQGVGVTGLAHVTAFANPGWNYFKAYSSGHVMTTTAARLIPALPPGQKFDIGRVDLLPLGTFHLKGKLSAPAGGASPWAPPGVPDVSGTVCSSDGYQTSLVIPAGTYYGLTFNLTSANCFGTGCFTFGNQVTLPAPPLRSWVVVSPDITGVCVPGIPQWPITGSDPPVWSNYTMVNLTAGHQLAAPDPVWVNYSIGDYIAGRVAVTGSSAVPAHFLVAMTSTDNAYYNSEALNFNPDNPLYNDYTPCAAAMPKVTGSFCIGVPPGNAKITVSAPNYATNWTWVHTPDYCCKTPSTGQPGWPTSLALATTDHVSVINLTPNAGQIWGYTIIANTASQIVPIVSVTACPAAQLSTQPCGSGLGINGTFYNVPAPVGTDVVTVSAPGYSPNRAWVNVTAGGNTSLGVMPMYPLGVLAGRVAGPNGTPIYLADVQYCPIAQAIACETGGGGLPLGPGVTTSDGEFNGTVPGGWLPWATYVVSVTAPGYGVDFAFANASVGNTTTLPTITLSPIGTNTSGGGGGGGGGGSLATGVNVAGRVYSNQTGGVSIAPGGGIAFCPLASYGCIPVPDGTDTEGFFNVSLPPGLYFLNLTEPGFQALSVFVNASAAGFLDLGTIYVLPDWWIAGRVVINPWQSISLSTSGLYGAGYAPSVSVQGCDKGRNTCLPAIPAATNGSFNVPIPIGNSATLVMTGVAPQSFGSPAGGFEYNTTTINNLTEQNTTLSGAVGLIPLDIFGVVSGRVYSNNTVNDSTTGLPAYGLPFSTVSLVERGNFSGSISYFTDGGGAWTFLLPGGSGPNATLVSATNAPAFNSVGGVIQDPIVSGYAPANGGNMSLNRFGWIQTTFRAMGTGDPVAYVAAQTSYSNGNTGAYYSANDVANLAGFLNVSAPMGPHIAVVSTAPDFNTSQFTVNSVNSSATTFANGTGPTDQGIFWLPAYGWVVSTTVNYTNGQGPPLSSLPVAVIRDPVNGLGVPEAQLQVLSTDPTVANGGSKDTNWAGQFYSDAPIGDADQVQVTREGYLSNTTSHVVHAGNYTIFSVINLTGMTVVAGLVTATPGNAPIGGAAVSVCGMVKNQGVCDNGRTNLSGVFWVLAPPGALTITVSALNYVSSVSYATGCSDCWVYAGHLNLSSYGLVSGNVRGLPSGFPLTGANASLCSPLGSPTGACGPAVATNAYGHFVITAPPGSYVLAVNDSFYNSSYLPVSLSAGEQTTVGTIFLSEFGTVQGRIYDGVTHVALPDATVIACSEWSGGSCAPAQTTDASGAYVFSAAPGTYDLQVSLAGYVLAPNEAPKAKVIAGLTTTAPDVALYSIGTDAGFILTGRTIDHATLAPIAGVTISAYSGSSLTRVGQSNGTGGFALQVPFGDYTLVAQKTGYAPTSIPVTAQGVHSNLVLALDAMTYQVSGVVVDALTTEPVAGAVISTVVNGLPTSVLASSDVAGAFQMNLPNGTWQLVASAAPTASIAYADTYFVIEVNGRAQVHNLTMTPGLSTVRLVVVNAISGIPLASATVVLTATLEQVYKVNQRLTTIGDGSVAAPLYVGQYTAKVTLPGFVPATVAFGVNGTGPTLVMVHLVPQGSGTSVASSSTGGIAALLLGGGLLAAAAVGALLLFRPRNLRSSPMAPKAEPASGGTQSP